MAPYQGNRKQGTMTMKAQLQALQQQDPACVFIARRINKLGFSSPDQLRAYFGRFGEVASVHVAHSLVKSTRIINNGRTAESHYRQRPAALGFVVMRSPEATTKILTGGIDHVVNGIRITVQTFHRHNQVCVEGDDASGSDSEVASSRDQAGEVEDSARHQSLRPRHREISPVCTFCGSTVAVHLGINICQVCRRWVPGSSC
mmetsp:Transcript_18396/g.36076  ORF Transcript_18396/g.36076 Transcript_18396/m.36076 type:complete len:202 (-) Transcript_18396:188-793(-)